ncbi:hypothetical protein ATCC51561_5 [Campylobacter concisus ATCC 51561]|nr:hypothetical protein ATCC51561_5 [Campylobacter concisus ATCC 51561]
MQVEFFYLHLSLFNSLNFINFMVSKKIKMQILQTKLAKKVTTINN